MKTITNAPRWAVYGIILIAALAAWGWVKPWITGPDVVFGTMTRTVRVPVPVEVESVKWLRKVERVRVEVPVQVIREVPAKQAKMLADKFDLKLPEMHAEGRELVDVIEVPPAPRGGEMALTVSAAGEIAGIFREKPAPFLEIGGVREVGVDYDAVNGSLLGYYRQDLARVGPAVINGKVFGGVPLGVSPGGRNNGANFGASIGVAVRF